MRMLRKQRARARRDRGAKPNLAADPGFPLSARSFVPERISKVLDSLAGHVLKKLAVFRDFPVDARRRYLHQVWMGRGVSADRHQRVTRQLAQLIFRERFSIDQGAAVDRAVRDGLAQMRQQAEIVVDQGFDALERDLLAGKARTFEAQPR